MSVLMTACKNNGAECLELIKYLVTELNADVQFASDQGTPFLKAVGSNNMDIVDWLIEKEGPSLAQKTDTNGVTALYYAVFRGN